MIFSSISKLFFETKFVSLLDLNLNNNKINVSSARIIDVLGKTIQEIPLEGKALINIQIETKGFYIIKLYNPQGNVANQKLIIE